MKLETRTKVILGLTLIWLLSGICYGIAIYEYDIIASWLIRLLSLVGGLCISILLGLLLIIILDNIDDNNSNKKNPYGT